MPRDTLGIAAESLWGQTVAGSVLVQGTWSGNEEGAEG